MKTAHTHNYHRHIRIPSILLWFNLVAVVATGQVAEVGQQPTITGHAHIISSFYSATRQTLQTGQEQPILLASATPKGKTPKTWMLALATCILASSLIALSLVYRATKQQALQLKLLNQQLYSREQQLRRHNAKLEQFHRIAAHDILSNLNLIISAGNVWIGERPKKENLMRYHEMTHRSIHRLKIYCLDILEEARNQRTEPPQAATDPIPILNRVLENFAPALQAARFNIQKEILSPASLPAAVQEQVFRNLVDNAIHHAASAQHPLLHITEEVGNGGVVYWALEDNGPGIPQAQREAIFNTRTTPKEGPGQQIGLSLLRIMLREYGADIWVEERKGGGARFVVATGRCLPHHTHERQ